MFCFVFGQPPKKLGPYYSAEVVFNSQEEANQAFDNVNGDIVKVLGIISLTVVMFMICCYL